MADAFLEAFFSNAKEDMRARKDSEVVDFMRAHWKCFCESRARMSALCQELDGRNDLSPEALSEALGLHSVVFRRAKVAEAVGLLVDPCKSPLLRAYRRALGERAKAEGSTGVSLCMFIVAGRRSLVVTNMRPERVPGSACLRIDNDGDEDISVFEAGQALKRLPGLFSQFNQREQE